MDPSSLDIRPFVEPTFGENAYVVSTTTHDGRRPGWVIDPGLGRQPDLLLAYASSHQIAIEKILLTHGHGDHVAGVDTVRGAWSKAELLIGGPDAAMLTDPQLNLSAPFGFDVVVETPVARHLEPEMELLLGDLKWSVLDTSGHSPGGRSLYCPAAGVVFTGDALFSGSIGRTDFPGSDAGRLIANIHRHLLTLPGETVVYSGHGPSTTIRNEQKFNPFLSDAYS